MRKTALSAFAATLFLAAGPAPVLAAEAYDNCNGYIDSVPAVLATQGVWCLRDDISTAIESGAAITIATNNVTIDCNDFKLGGLAAGTDSNAVGIEAVDRLNATVRNCAIRGFRHGISFTGDGGGHLVEDNRLDGNLTYGIRALGSGNHIARNRVIDTGGHDTPVFSVGINANGDIIDNTVDGVFTSANNAYVRGISTDGYAVEVSGNRVRGLAPHGTGAAQGIVSSGPSVAVMDNRVMTGTSGANDRGLYFFDTTPDAFCGGNTISGFTVPVFGDCTMAGENFGN